MGLSASNCGNSRDLSLRNVRFVGRVPPEHMPALYDEHDVWLNGSDVDNMPTSILEAYACGLTVASINPGGIPYIVEDGRTGRLVQCRDSEALAEAALEVIGNPALFAELTRNGLAQCANYTWDLVKQGWITTYSGLAPKGTSLYPRQT